MLLDGTRVLNRDMLIMNLLVTVWMEQHSVFVGIGAAERALYDMVIVPSSYLGDFLLANRTDAVLFFPEAQELSSTF